MVYKMSSSLIQVLVAEDSMAFREGLRDLFGATPDIHLTGDAVNGLEACSLAKRLQPDVILMDLQMPELNGIEATRRILSSSPHIAILVLTMYDDDESIFAAMRAGARGYLLKGALKAEILQAIRSVAAGGAIFSPAIANRLVKYFSQMSTVANSAFPELTEREQEVLVLIAKHHTNQEIAQKLKIRPKTVRNHVSNIFAKLQVADRAEAIIRARDAGIGRDPPLNGSQLE
jgi:DNA-binding NarL/FixJ family response regulator